MPKLTIRTGPQRGAEFTLRTSIVIGRGAAADVPIADTRVSRRHALLICRSGEWVVEDLGSANGTLVNGQRIFKPTRLREGDILAIGSVHALYSERSETLPAQGSELAVRYLDLTQTHDVLLRIAVEKRAEPRDTSDTGRTETMFPRRRFSDDLGTISDLAFDENALLSLVVDELFARFRLADRVSVMLWNRDRSELVPSVGRARSGRSIEIVTSRTLLDEVVARREAVLAADAQLNSWHSSEQSTNELALRSMICVPIIFQKELYGVIQIDSVRGGLPFGKGELDLALGFGSQVAMTLGYARLHEQFVERELLERDLALARRIQQRFLPRSTPAVDGYAFSAECRPALAVGGDFYDFLDLGGGLIGVVVGDVSGKGVSAALYAAKLSSDLRYQAAGHTEPAVILDHANRTLAGGDQEGMFVTVSVTVLDSKNARLSVASAGHPLPLVRDARGEIVAIGGAGNAPLGVDEHAMFEQYHYEIDCADSVVMYTDGVIEAANGHELFAERRLIDAVRRSDGSVDGVTRTILSDLHKFVGEHPQMDDVTVVCFGRDPKPST